jgi:hypothetical protein
MTTNIDDITAGEYELVALQWDQQTSKPREPFDFVRHRQGDRVTLNVEDARRLYAAGAVVKPGEREAAAAAAAAAAFQAALALVPEHMRAQITAHPAPEPQPSVAPGDDPAPAGGDTGGGADKPTKNAPKSAWVDFAVTEGMPRADAETATKDELIERFGG